MSLPVFSTQAELFSTAGLSGQLFAPTDRYRLFAQKVYPVLAQTRSQLEDCYCSDNGRVAVEPVLLLGVSLLQYLEGIPDRQAVELVRYHAGWNFALNRQVGDEVFHPTTLVNFRERLLDHDLSPIAFQTVLEALIQAGLVARRSRQRLDSTQMFGRVSRMSRLDCVRETLRLTLQELSEQLPPAPRPGWWSQMWEQYVETQTDYRASLETLARKMAEAGAAAQQVLRWLAQAPDPKWAAGKQAQLLARVFDEPFEVLAAEAVPRPKAKEPLGSERVQNPHDPDATYASKGHGEQRKEHVGYKVQVAETVSEAVLAAGEPTRNFVTGMVTHPARESDEEGALKMEAEQQAMGVGKPSVQYVDAAYISAQKLWEAQAEGRELIGPAPSPANNNDGRKGKPFPRALLLVALFSGTGILAAEVIANQMFMLVATLSFYAPAAILFGVIFSLAVGAFVAPRLRRRAAGIPSPSLIAGVMGVAALVLAGGPLIFMGIVQHVDMLEMNGSVGEFIIKLVLLVFVSLGPGFLLAGLVFPLAISWLAEAAGDGDGKKLGWLLAVNGLGGVVGAETAYRILLPLFNLHTAMGIVAISYALAGLALSLRSQRRVSWIGSHAVAVAGVALLVILGLRPLPLISKDFRITVLDHRSGREGSVAVVENNAIGRCILVDNQYVLGGSHKRAFEERQAHLPLLLHPAPCDVAFIGLATGITPGAALLHSNLNSITVVELSPLVERAADKFFGQFNHHITQSKRATVVVDDGRTVIAAAPGRFDVVIGDLFLPWAPGEARLYSVEHFRDVRRSLRPGGVFCQWLAMYQFTPRQFQIIADTFRKVFPHTCLFCNALDSQLPALALVGFRDDQELNWRTITGRCAAWQKSSSLNRDALLGDSASVAQMYLGEWKLPTSESPVAINTLGNLLIELDAGRERLTVSPGTKYVYGRRWLKFCHERRAEMAAEGLPMNSPLTMSSLERADSLMREIYQEQVKTQAR